MLVGQAPGRVEAHGGAPFSGRAGRTLFGWFATVGMHEPDVRARMYIAAVTRCYPGPSESGRGDRVPDREERERCAGWLHAELRIVRPKLIVPVGRLAIDAMLGPRPLAEIIGREHAPGGDAADWLPNRGTDTTIIPLPHPSGASSWIHLPGHRALLDRALSLIARRWRALVPGARVA